MLYIFEWRYRSHFRNSWLTQDKSNIHESNWFNLLQSWFLGHSQWAPIRNLYNYWASYLRYNYCQMPRFHHYYEKNGCTYRVRLGSKDNIIYLGFIEQVTPPCSSSQMCNSFLPYILRVVAISCLLLSVVSIDPGFRATFMPKPFVNKTGNGAHCHVSVWSPDGKTNLFHDDHEQLVHHHLLNLLSAVNQLTPISNFNWYGLI